MDISTGTWKQPRFFGHRNDIEKSAWKQRGFFDQRITLKKVRGNNMDFSTTKITLQKVRGNEVDFSISEVRSNKYMEMTWKFVKISSSTNLCNIDVESTWIRRGVPVGKVYNYLNSFSLLSRMSKRTRNKVSYNVDEALDYLFESD